MTLCALRLYRGTIIRRPPDTLELVAVEAKDDIDVVDADEPA